MKQSVWICQYVSRKGYRQRRQYREKVVLASCGGEAHNRADRESNWELDAVMRFR